MSSLSQNLEKVATKPVKKPALWRGPLVDGVTQSLLGKYLVCKERFRLLVVEGLKTTDGFSNSLEYGNLWHAAEEGLAAGEDWNIKLLQCARGMAKRYPMDGAAVDKWYNVAKIQFPVYVEWWAKHKDVTSRTPLFQEEKFAIPYETSPGRVVTLRGKFDSVDLLGKKEIWLQENKTKGDIEPDIMQRQLQFDLQTMLYLVALEEKLPTMDTTAKLRGVRYNVVRRPLSGGRNSIRQHQPTKSKPNGESPEEFYDRLAGLIKDAVEPDGSHYYFMRWKVEVSTSDIVRFKREFLNPILENILDDYEWWVYCHAHKMSPFDYQYRSRTYPHHANRHYRMPFGVYNPLLEGRATDLDEYLSSGSETGLQRCDNLFPEL